MRSVTLIGRIGGDASVEKSKNGNEFIKFSIATQEYNEKDVCCIIGPDGSDGPDGM